MKTHPKFAAVGLLAIGAVVALAVQAVHPADESAGSEVCFRQRAPRYVKLVAGALSIPSNSVAAQGPAKTDSPLFGGTTARNMINLVDKNIPVEWNVEEGKFKNVKWVAEFGDKSYGGPVIANGQIYVGTNQRKNAHAVYKEPKAILMCYRESDGKYLWHIAHDIPPDVTSMEAPSEGLCSTPAVDGDLIFYMAPGCEVIAADTNGKVKWTYNLNKKHKVFPHHLANCSPLVAGDLVMIITGNGTDEEGKILTPDAPSFVAINKKTGELAWQSNLPGKNVIEGQFSNPTLATLNGKQQVIFPGGDSVLYSFEPTTGKLIWKCDCVPVRVKKGAREIDNYFVATPVVVGDRLYVGMGVAPMNSHTPRSSYFICLDITKTGDVSFKSYDAKDAKNKDSALVWAFGGPIDPAPEKGRQVRFGPTISTAAVHDGLVYVAEEAGYMHCLDAKTGQRYWDHDFRASVWGSPYWVDGKIYIGTDEGDVVIFAHGKTRRFYVKGKLLDGTPENDRMLPSAGVEAQMHATPVVANGVLYMQTRYKLYAIR